MYNVQCTICANHSSGEGSPVNPQSFPPLSGGEAYTQSNPDRLDDAQGYSGWRRCLRRVRSVFQNALPLIINNLAYIEGEVSFSNTGEKIKFTNENLCDSITFYSQNLEISSFCCTFAPSNI